MLCNILKNYFPCFEKDSKSTPIFVGITFLFEKTCRTSICTFWCKMRVTMHFMKYCSCTFRKSLDSFLYQRHVASILIGKA